MAIHLFQWLAINWMIFCPIFTMEQCLDVRNLHPSKKKTAWLWEFQVWQSLLTKLDTDHV